MYSICFFCCCVCECVCMCVCVCVCVLSFFFLLWKGPAEHFMMAYVIQHHCRTRCINLCYRFLLIFSYLVRLCLLLSRECVVPCGPLLLPSDHTSNHIKRGGVFLIDGFCTVQWLRVCGLLWW
jgi:hypothetical protein